VKRRIPEVSSDLAGHASPVPPGTLEPESQEETGDRAVGRRALLTRGGVVVAGVVGAGVAGAAVAAPASAATGDPVLQGKSNSVGTNQPATEVTVANDPATPTPTVVLTNTGGNATTFETSPSLRLTPAADAAFLFPANATAGGDMVATNDGNLWFTHAVPNVGTFPATVHTDANSNSFVPLAAPQRMLDTRTSGGRANVLDPSGKFDSTGRLLAGKTIHLDLSSLVFFADAVTANLTVTKPAALGHLTLWSGGVALPSTSSINYAAGQTIANLTVSGLAQFSQTATDTIAIFAFSTTHVILDVDGFTVGSFGQVNPAFLAPTMSRSARAQRAKQALAKLRTQKG
jgi:hypothetical protein